MTGRFLTMGLCWVLAGPMKAPAQGILFSLSPKQLSLSECVAEPGAVAIPVAATNLNLEVVDWRTEPGPSPEPGVFTMVFKEPTSVGTLLAYDAGEVSYRVGETWEVLDPGTEAGRSLQMIPFPEGVKVQSIRLTRASHPAGQDASGRMRYQSELPFVTLIPVRLSRVTAPAVVTAHCGLEGAAGGDGSRLLDGRVDAVRNLALGEHAITDDTPEWIMFQWDTPQTVRGVLTFRGTEDPGLGKTFVEVYTGDGDPTGSEVEGWERPVGRRTPPGPFRSAQIFVAFKPVTGRAMRLISTEGGMRSGLGEVVVTRDVKDNTAVGP